MTANTPLPENELVEAAVAWLTERLPSTWEIARPNRVEPNATPSFRADCAVDLRSPNGVYTTMVIEAKRSFGPRDVERLLPSLLQTIRTIVGRPPILVVAPWLSERTQELLRSQGINYLDRTGNALINLDNPTVFIQTQGAKKDPSPAPRGKARVQGPKAGRLVRTLVDVRPPYGVRELAAATDLTPSYVSRLLDALDDEALVERTSRGRVESVAIPGLIRRWAETYDVFKSNNAKTYLSASGANTTVPRLATLPRPPAVTGSFAAVRLAPVAGPALLMAYSNDPSAVADALDLIPTDVGANVVLLRPFDPVAWERATVDNTGITYVAPSQIAVDCLTGNGRMPAEGDAVIQWMTGNEPAWRLSTLPAAQEEEQQQQQQQQQQQREEDEEA